MTLRFKWEWESAPEVRIPELAATWCRLNIELGETPATLVERRDGSAGPRHGLDVAAYPLAEFFALNWWRLSATSHIPSDRGVRLVEAGQGFAWPDLTLRSDRDSIWATLRQRDKAPEHVRFLTQTETVFEIETALASIADFIDSTVRRLESSNIVGTLLQDEWAAIQQADQDERDYCLVASAWGQDPYDTEPNVEKLLIRAGRDLGDPLLLADLARAVPLATIVESVPWLREASGSLNPDRVPPLAMRSISRSVGYGAAPWRVGYDRARDFRQLLHLASTTPAPVEELLTVHQTISQAPINVDGLVSSTKFSLAIVVGAGGSWTTKRFAASRALGRKILSTDQGRSLLTRSTQYTERAERAFAAEFLAPAVGVAEMLNGDFSDDSIREAARHFKVDAILVEHQVENQIAA